MPGSIFNFNYVENDTIEVVFPNTCMAKACSQQFLGHWALEVLSLFGTSPFCTTELNDIRCNHVATRFQTKLNHITIKHSVFISQNWEEIFFTMPLSPLYWAKELSWNKISSKIIGISAVPVCRIILKHAQDPKWVLRSWESTQLWIFSMEQ